MAANENLHKAKKAKNDEFYTQLSDVSKELVHYKQHFQGKIVFCNCDDPTTSAFWRYFHLNFAHLGLKKLISTHYDPHQPTYKMEYEGGDDEDVEVGVKTPLEGNGDFRNQECLDLMDEADIVCTNPPWSLFRDYIEMLIKHKKYFLVLGNKNAITYKEIFPLLNDNLVWLGYGGADNFMTPDGETKKVNGLARWFTNLDIQKRHEKLILWKHYTPEEFPKYDNYDAINVDKVSEIPCDYEPCWYKCPHAAECEYAKTEGRVDRALCEDACNGEIGVPITYLDKHNKEQFEIVANGGSYSGEGSIADALYVTNDGLRESTHTHTHTEGLQADHHSPDAGSVAESSESQSRSLISTTLNNSISSELSITEQTGSGTSAERKLTESKYSSALQFARKCSGMIGVPITFLDKYNPEQFQILGITQRNDDPFKIKKYTSNEYTNANDLNARATIMVNSIPKSVYARLLICKKA